MSPVKRIITCKGSSIFFEKKTFMTPVNTASIAEIFSAIQGEGPIVGVRQLFIRFYNCNISCNWCDTPAAKQTNGPCIVEEFPGNRKNITVNNPFYPVDLFKTILPFLSFPHHSISLTGGEPLLYHKFLQEFLPIIKQYNNNNKKSCKIYLETNGILHDALEKVLPWIDIIGMDWKLPSSAKTKDLTKQHAIFLQKTYNHDLFIKIIMTKDTDNKELIHACNIIADKNPEISVILQPVTNFNNSADIMPPTPKQLLDWQETALHYCSDVRVIPQTHVFMGQR